MGIVKYYYAPQLFEILSLNYLLFANNIADNCKGVEEIILLEN
jgi:hypothetical protein